MYFHKSPERFPFVYLWEYEDVVLMVNNVRNNYEGFTSDKIKRDDAAYKALGRLRNPTSDNFEKMERSN